MSNITVIIGTRGFGIPCARRLAQGGPLLLADRDGERLAAAAAQLNEAGCRVETETVDVADRVSVRALAGKARSLGSLKAIINTAGLSPSMGTPEQIFTVNMLGTIYTLEEFEPLAEEGSVAVQLASNAGYMAPLDPDYERILANAPAEQQLEHFRRQEIAANGLGAYCLSKRGTQLRVETAALAWGKRKARVVSISPGVMATAMSAFEREAGAQIDEAIANTPVGRPGQAEDIAAAIEWAVSSQASFFTGADLLVDGGMSAALKWSEFTTSSVLEGY